MSDISPLLNILDTLLSPDGCPWDQKQTLDTIKGDLLEETCELIDAIEKKNGEEVIEELGDVFFVTLFLCRLAEKAHYGSLKDVIAGISAKLIRRHPHIFEEKKVLNDEELLTQWEAIKALERKKPRHPLERIPKALPALSKTLETLKAFEKHQLEKPLIKTENDTELKMGKALFDLVENAKEENIDPEFALRKYLSKLTEAYHSD